MQKILYGLIGLLILLGPVPHAKADISIGIGLPNVSIGINLPLFPELVPVPGYPVYYAPRLDANYFFYDGMYWVYQGDNWYSSSWYNGPWWPVEPELVPLFILRVPVSYYRQPPEYFREWRSNAPPRWGQHWGRDWEQRRSGWDRWNRSSAPARAPLPVYQRQYSGDSYPRQIEQQHKVRSQSYRYQPRDKVVRENFKRQVEQRAPAPAQRGRQEAPAMTPQRQHEPARPAPRQQVAPPAQQQQQQLQRAPEVRDQKQQREPAQHQQREPGQNEKEKRPQDRDDSNEPGRDRGQGHDKNDERGRGHNK